MFSIIAQRESAGVALVLCIRGCCCLLVIWRLCDPLCSGSVLSIFLWWRYRVFCTTLVLWWFSCVVYAMRCAEDFCLWVFVVEALVLYVRGLYCGDDIVLSTQGVAQIVCCWWSYRVVCARLVLCCCSCIVCTRRCPVNLMLVRLLHCLYESCAVVMLLCGMRKVLRS